MSPGQQPANNEPDTILEPNLESAFRRLVDEGSMRLDRTARELLVTAFVAGTEVATGVLALLAVQKETGSHLLAGLAFSIGFLALLLGRSELFTESFLVPVIAVAAGHGRARNLGRLWGGTLVANLAGGWVITWLMMRAFPDLHETAVTAGTKFATSGWTLQNLCLTVLAGSSITLMTRMQHGTEELVGKIAAAVAGAFLLAGLQMYHSVLDSLLIFCALHTGQAPFGYLNWLNFLAMSVLGNAVGGLGLVTLLRLLRTKDRVLEERVRAGAD